MAVQTRTIATATVGSSPRTVARPSGTSEGDLLLLQVTLSADIAPSSLPEGFVPVTDGALTGTHNIRLYSKRAGASEPSNYSVEFASGTGGLVLLGIFSDIPSTPAIVQVVGQNNGAGDRIWPSVTASIADSLLACFGAFSENTASTPHTGMTERADFGGPPRVYLMTQTLIPVGATGERTATGTSVLSSRCISVLVSEPTGSIAIRSVATGTGGSPSVAVNKPVGTIAGDLLVLEVGMSVDAAPTSLPSGFTLIPGAEITGTNNIRIYQKVAGSSEPDTYTVSVASGNLNLGMAALYAIDESPVEDDAVATRINESGNRVWDSVTPSAAGSLLTCFGAFGGTLNTNPSGAMKEYWDTGGFQPRIYLMAQILFEATATGTRSATGIGMASKCVTIVFVPGEGEEPPPDLDPLVAPTDLIATGISTSQIDLEWTDTNTDETNFRLERSDDGLSGWSEIATSTGTTYSNTGLSPGRRYWYRVRAYRSEDATFSDYSSDAIGRTDLAAPTNLIATTISTTEITLTWTDPNGEAEGYEVQRSVDEENWTSLDPVTETVLEDSELEPETTYYYRIRAFWEE